MVDLVEAGAKAAARATTEEARLYEQRARQSQRERLAGAGVAVLQSLREALFSRICAEVLLSERRGPDVLRIHNDAQVVLRDRRDPIPPPSRSRLSKWDFVAGAMISVEQFQARYVRSASLWYAQRPGESDFRWYEVAYETSPMLGERRRFEPFAIENVIEADRAAGPGMHTIQIASGPHLVDDENAQEFCDRWCSVLARAVNGTLHEHR